MGKAKRASIFIRLVSAAGTGFFYVKRKNPRRITEKLEFRKYDPRVNKHVLFTEAKMKTQDKGLQLLHKFYLTWRYLLLSNTGDFSGLLFITRITGPGLLIAAF
uniref:Large ribosomal subunit protein bL33c n=1 Tax=Oryza meridionalis TaxID=40149 RepID=A0A0E0DSA8_9ORYZ